MREDLLTLLALLTIDGMDGAFIGVLSRCGQPDIACYDYDLCVEALTRGGMTARDAVEYIEFNIEGAWLGADTPALLRQGFYPKRPSR